MLGNYSSTNLYQRPAPPFQNADSTISFLFQESLIWNSPVIKCSFPIKCVVRSARTVIRPTVAGSMPGAVRRKLSWVTGVYLHLVAAECLSAMFISILRLLRYRHVYGLDIQYKQTSERETQCYPPVKIQLKRKESALLVAQLDHPSPLLCCILFQWIELIDL